MSLGDNILKIREKMGLSAEKFGSLIGVTKQMIYEYEKGKSIPGKEILSKIAEVGKVSVSDLYSEIELKEDGIALNEVPEAIYRNLVEANTEYRLVPKVVLNEEYRIVLIREIESREAYISKIIELAERDIAAKEKLIDQLQKEIEALRTQVHFKKAQ